MDPRLLDILKMEFQVHGDDIFFINGPLDLTMLLGIAAHVLKDNLSGFFADLPSVLNRAGKAAESDG